MHRSAHAIATMAGGMLVAASLIFACSSAAGDPIRGKEPQRVQDRYVPDPPELHVETWISGLELPWSLVFLPDGRALVSERPGRIRLIEGKDQLAPELYASLSVHTGGEGGLMGLAVHPQFPDQPFAYAMYTSSATGRAVNRVARLRHHGTRADFDSLMLDDIPAARFHNGGRLAFGPDGMLYVTTGDATQPSLAQQRDSLAGKILRIDPLGRALHDNPIPRSPVWSLGHRNPQGLAWQPETHELFESEHGPTGELGLSAHDEINVILEGRNYGWPRVVGAAGKRQFTDPLISWNDRAVPPSGVAFWNGDLYVATLASQALVRIGLERKEGNWQVTRIERLFATGPGAGRFGRLRDAVAGPDGALYVLTSNRGDRGEAGPNDDRILRITR